MDVRVGTIKKAEGWRIDAFKLWCWRRPVRVPWTTRRWNQINHEYSLEGLMLKVKLRYFGHLTWRADSLEKTLILEKMEGKKRRRGQRMKWLDSTTTQRTWIWANSRRYWRTDETGMLKSKGWQRVGHDSDWTTIFICWVPNPQWDSIRTWDLWETINS